MKGKYLLKTSNKPLEVTLFADAHSAPQLIRSAKMKYKIQLFLSVVFLFPLYGCLSEDSSRSLGEGIGAAVSKELSQSIESSVESELVQLHDLLFATNWYYKVNGRWPDNREDLELFVKEHHALFNFERYSTLEFIKDKDEGVTINCSYTPSGDNLSGEINTRIKLSAEQAAKFDASGVP